jgi:homoserine kinase type II
LQGGDDDLLVIGETLGRVHDALARVDVSGAPGFDWVDPDAPHLDVAPWVRPAVRSALREWEAVRPRVHTWTFLHGDPAPEAFLVSPDRGVCGLVDWSSGCLGPCLYDLASAVMYVGAGAADRLVEAYLSHSPMHRAEVDLGLRPMLRLRWAVQADYFARRIVERDLTGLDDGTGNQKGLDDARRALLGRGLDKLERPGG